MAHSQITTTYTGGDKVFAIPFDFIDKDYITVSANGIEVSDFEIDNFTVMINSNLTAGDIIVITRHTDAKKLLVTYTGRNDLNSSSLNISNTQLFHLVQETLDLINQALILNYLGQWDCKNLILRNVAEGIQGSDATTVAQSRRIAQYEVNIHQLRNDNPHEVTKAQIGLSNCNNTSDTDKPLSKSAIIALNNKVDKVEGKELSSQDFTLNEKQKLSGVEIGAQVNYTKVSQLVNDSKFISSNTLKSSDNLQEGNLNKYDKTITIKPGANILVTGSYPDFTISSTGSTSKVNWGGIEGIITNQKDLINFVENKGGGIEWNELLWNYPDSNTHWKE